MIDICLLYTWPVLYTRLVTHDRLHILTSIICLQLFYLSSICTLIHVIVIQCLFIMLFSVCSYLLLFYAHCYMHEFSSLHTHSPGRFLTTLDLHVQILDALFLLFRCSLRPYTSRRAGGSPYSVPVFLSFLTFWLFPYSRYIRFSCYSSSSFNMISCVDAYMWYCSNYDLLQLGFIACPGLLEA